MKRTITTLLATAAAVVTFAQQPQPGSLSAADAFIENKGQITDQYGNTREDIDFRFAADDVQVFVGGGKIHYQWIRTNAVKPFDRTAPTSAAIEAETYRMDVSLLGANQQAQMVAEQPRQVSYRYYTPPTAQGAVAAAYGKVTYKNVYPNIDWVVYSKNGKLEYDFVVHPGGRVSDIQIAYEGASALDITAAGQLKAVTPFGSVTEAAPYSYNREGREVASAFTRTGNVIGFTTGTYTGTLTIDPVVSWVSYYGGNGLYNVTTEQKQDRNGNLYVSGMTSSFANIATVGAFQTTLNGSQDGFLAKFNTESILQWATYYGGPAADWAYGVALDTLGHVYVSGETTSLTGLATANSFQPNHGGGTSPRDAYLAQFDTSGARIWGTYYGGAEKEYVGRVTSDGSSTYLILVTRSTGLATPGAHKTVPENDDHMLVKFNAAGQRQWATYFGGSAAESTFNPNIVTDANGDVYITGNTGSDSAIATVGSHQPVLGGVDDIYLAKFSPQGQLLWATYYGGSGSEENRMFFGGIAVDKQNNVLISGGTQSTDGIASTGAYQPVLAGSFDAFVAKFSPSGERLWGTYLGGAGEEALIGLVCSDSAIYAVGHTNSSGMATSGAIDSTYGGASLLEYGDAWLTRFSPGGQLEYSTYFGGSGDDIFLSANLHQGYLYLAGVTNSIGLGTPGTWQPDYPGGFLNSILLARICTADIPVVGQIAGPDTVCSNDQVEYTIPLFENADQYLWDVPAGWAGLANDNKFTVQSFGASGVITVRVIRCNDTSSLLQLQVTVHEPVEAIIEEDNGLLSTVNTHASYQWYGNDILIPGATQQQYEVLENASYYVVTVDDNGCVDTSNVIEAQVSVDELRKLANSVKVFPNPATDIAYIQSAEPVYITVSGIVGQQLQQLGDARVIDMRAWQPGAYLLKIYTKDHKLLKTEKLMKLN